jgi:glucose/arabinose dehydrogenase
MTRAAAIASLALALAASAAHGENLTGPVEQVADVPVAEGYAIETVVEGLERPWGMAWLPSGDILVTERGGTLRLVRGGTTLDPEPVPGLPSNIREIGQGGLMDVSIHPRFQANRLVYFTHAMGDNDSNRTALTQARWDDGRLSNVETIWINPKAKKGGQHFGSRILWLPDGSMLVSIGDGGNPPSSVDGEHVRNKAQDLDYAFGKTIRLSDDGAPVGNNPFTDTGRALPEVYSYGHRNIQGLALDPATGRVWATEHGSRGGDEVNLIEPGKNYGWPEVTYSIEYWGPRISDKTTAPGMVDPVTVWTPCIAPSGLTFYTGDKFPQWKNDLLAGGLVAEQVRVVHLDGAEAGEQRKIPIDGRVRDVRQGPDGLIYILTDQDDGKLLRIKPE